MKRRVLIQTAVTVGLGSLMGVRAVLAKDVSGIELLKRYVKEVERAEGGFEQVMYDKSGKKVDGPLRGMFAFQ